MSTQQLQKFKRFMKDHDAWVRFLYNMQKQHPERKAYQYFSDIANDKAIGGGFLWYITKEGQTFWETLNVNYNNL